MLAKRSKRSILSPAVSRRAQPIPATLRKWRAAMEEQLGAKYTQGHVASAAGVTLKTVQSWEQGWRIPSPETEADWEKMANAYGVWVEEMKGLVGGGNRGTN